MVLSRALERPAKTSSMTYRHPLSRTPKLELSNPLHSSIQPWLTSPFCPSTCLRYCRRLCNHVACPMSTMAEASFLRRFRADTWACRFNYGAPIAQWMSNSTGPGLDNFARAPQLCSLPPKIRPVSSSSLEQAEGISCYLCTYTKDQQIETVACAAKPALPAKLIYNCQSAIRQPFVSGPPAMSYSLPKPALDFLKPHSGSASQ